MSILSYDEFKSIMTGVVKEIRFQNKIYSAMMGAGFNGEYYREIPTLESTLMLLDKIFKDDSDYPLIDYWVYELDCGESWKPDSVIDDNGDSIPLKTISNLYDELVRQYANKGKE